MTSTISSKQIFYKRAFKLILPIVIQNLLSATISSTDVVMLNYVGQSSISAVSLASQYTNILFTFFFGMGTGATMLCAQYYGKGDFRAIHAVEGIALRFSIIVSIAFASAALLIPQYMMKVFTNDAQLIEIGVGYLRIVSVSYLCWGVMEIYMAVLKSIGRIAICTAANMVAFVVNIILNAVFIFGLFGAPKLGAAGVALGTTLSRIVQLICLIIVSINSKNVKMKLSFMFIQNKLLLSDFIRLSLPALLNDVIWGLAFSTYAVIIGHMGSDAVAANSFAAVVRNFGSILCFGVASATGVLLGNEIGQSNFDGAKEDAKRLIRLTVVTGLIGGLIILCATPFVLKYATLTDTAMHYLKYMLLINSYYVMGSAVNTTLIAGVFRAGGDSKFGFVCDTIDMWCYAVPLGFLAAFVFKLPVLWVYFLLCTDEFVKWPWVIKHYKSGKWMKNITRDNLFEET
ncbi:MAG: MATE family efflux transporter [Clostridia bacterium]|nr:MATE family efflux transporter [Clostridia bacterium]